MIIDMEALKKLNHEFNLTKNDREYTTMYLNLINVVHHKSNFKDAEEALASLEKIRILIPKLDECLTRPNRTGMDKVARDFKRQYQLHKDFLINHYNVIDTVLKIVYDNQDNINKNLLRVKDDFSEYDFYILLNFTKYRNILAHSSGETFLWNADERFLKYLMPGIINHSTKFLLDIMVKNSEKIKTVYQDLKNKHTGPKVNLSTKSSNEKGNTGEHY